MGDLQDLAGGLAADPLAGVAEDVPVEETHAAVVVAGVLVPVAPPALLLGVAGHRVLASGLWSGRARVVGPAVSAHRRARPSSSAALRPAGPPRRIRTSCITVLQSGWAGHVVAARDGGFRSAAMRRRCG